MDISRLLNDDSVLRSASPGSPLPASLMFQASRASSISGLSDGSEASRLGHDYHSAHGLESGNYRYGSISEMEFAAPSRYSRFTEPVTIPGHSASFTTGYHIASAYHTQRDAESPNGSLLALADAAARLEPSFVAIEKMEFIYSAKPKFKPGHQAWKPDPPHTASVGHQKLRSQLLASSAPTDKLFALTPVELKSRPLSPSASSSERRLQSKPQPHSRQHSAKLSMPGESLSPHTHLEPQERHTATVHCAEGHLLDDSPQSPKCYYTANCTTASPLRKVVSHIFGRNKISTRQIPRNVWVYYCRKHYQRARYRNPKGFALLQCDLVKRQVDRLHAWGGVVDWSVRVRRREQIRIEKEISNENESTEDSYLSDLGPAKSSQERPTSPSPSRRSASISSTSWLMNLTGSGRSTDDIKDILQQIELEIKENSGKFPEIEILPNVQGAAMADLIDLAPSHHRAVPQDIQPAQLETSPQLGRHETVLHRSIKRKSPSLDNDGDKYEPHGSRSASTPKLRRIEDYHTPRLPPVKFSVFRSGHAASDMAYEPERPLHLSNMFAMKGVQA